RRCLWRHRVPGNRAPARQDIHRGPRWEGAVPRHRAAVSGRPISLARDFQRAGSERARSGRADERGRDHHGRTAPLVPGARRAVPSRVGADRRRTSHPAELSRSLMFTTLIEKLVRHEDLTADEASAAMQQVMDGNAPSAALAGLLSALAMKGERPAEIVGFARTMRANAVKLSRPAGEVFDTCGTGGDRSGTFNISSAAALVVAACGVKVAKHGNRSVSSRCGSADVFEQLGVNIAAAPPVVERTLAEAKIAFLLAA